MEISASKQGAPLSAIHANRRIVETLFSNGVISANARREALELLYPTRNWGLWISRLLLTLGTSLVLSGIVYFFAFNWDKVPVAAKFGLVEGGLIGCIVGAYFAGLQGLPGKMLLLSASVLVGVFMAVFGQVYQTGADAYTLFMMWSALILPWVVIGEFAPLWVVWLAVTNLFIAFYVAQTAHSDQVFITQHVWLALFNCAVLALRELFAKTWPEWLGPRWTRFVLVIPILYLAMIPTVAFIFDRTPTPDANLGFLLALVIHGVFFALYRFGRPDMWALTATVLSSCTILELAIFRMMFEQAGHRDEIAVFLVMGLVTLGLFTSAIFVLRAMANAMEAGNA